MNCLEPTLSALNMNALSYSSRSLKSLASYCKQPGHRILLQRAMLRFKVQESVQLQNAVSWLAAQPEQLKGSAPALSSRGPY